MKEVLDHINRQLLMMLQEGLPVTEEPYNEFAGRLNITQEEVFARIRQMREAGLIRRISGFFHSGKLGYRSVLCAARVEPECLEEMAQLLDGIPGITHNYLRDHELNMWFTLCCESDEALEKTLRCIEESGLTDKVHVFPRVKAYKVHASFDLGVGES